eukprot:jgi/Bigna1/79434/fgenesh1_pg.62_\
MAVFMASFTYIMVAFIVSDHTKLRVTYTSPPGSKERPKYNVELVRVKTVEQMWDVDDAEALAECFLSCALTKYTIEKIKPAVYNESLLQRLYMRDVRKWMRQQTLYRFTANSSSSSSSSVCIKGKVYWKLNRRFDFDYGLNARIFSHHHQKYNWHPHDNLEDELPLPEDEQKRRQALVNQNALKQRQEMEEDEAASCSSTSVADKDNHHSSESAVLSDELIIDEKYHQYQRFYEEAVLQQYANKKNEGVFPKAMRVNADGLSESPGLSDAADDESGDESATGFGDFYGENNGSKRRIKSIRLTEELQEEKAVERFRMYFRYMRSSRFLRRSLPPHPPDFTAVARFICKQHAYGPLRRPRRLEVVTLLSQYPEIASREGIIMLKRLYQSLDWAFKTQAAPMKDFDKRWVVEAIATIKVLQTIYDFEPAQRCVGLLKEEKRRKEEATKRENMALEAQIIGSPQSPSSEEGSGECISNSHINARENQDAHREEGEKYLPPLAMPIL